jgi:hypothetical protein
VLQTSVGYSTKANVDVTGTGAGTGTTVASDLNAGQLGGSVITAAVADPTSLSTRQSIAVSALALANQSQQSVLQLLRRAGPGNRKMAQNGGAKPRRFRLWGRRRNICFAGILTHLVTVANHI